MEKPESRRKTVNGNSFIWAFLCDFGRQFAEFAFVINARCSTLQYYTLRRFTSYLLFIRLLCFLIILYLPRCTIPEFPSVSSQASLPFLSCCHRTTICFVMNARCSSLQSVVANILYLGTCIYIYVCIHIRIYALCFPFPETVQTSKQYCTEWFRGALFPVTIFSKLGPHDDEHCFYLVGN